MTANYAITIPSVADAYSIASLHVTSWKGTYPSLLPAETINALTVERRQSQWQAWLSPTEPKRFSRIARTEDGIIVGFVLAGPSRTVSEFADFELDALYVLKNDQRKGVGYGLLKEAIQAAKRHQSTSLGFWVVAGNVRAESFYRSNGAKQVAEKRDRIGDYEIVEIGYSIAL
jgi:GNAT superfamily N-acetyltransferase